MSRRWQGRLTRLHQKLLFNGIIPAQAAEIVHSLAWERAEQAM